MTYPISASYSNNSINLLNSSSKTKAGTSPNSVFSSAVASAYNNMLKLSGHNDSHINTGLALLERDLGKSSAINKINNIFSSLIGYPTASANTSINQTSANSLSPNISADTITSLYNVFTNKTNNPWKSLGTLIDRHL